MVGKQDGAGIEPWEWLRKKWLGNNLARVVTELWAGCKIAVGVYEEDVVVKKMARSKGPL